MYNYEWDIETGGYILLPSKITGVTKEVRPVFSEELRFLGLDRDYGWDFPDCEGPLMWAEARRYFYKGELVCEASGGGLYEMPTLKNVIKDLRITPVDIEMMLSKNESVMDGLVQKTLKTTYKAYLDYKSRVSMFYVAYSGGKDSIVMLDIVQRALPHDGFVVVFGDTTMELKTTYQALSEAKAHWPSLEWYEARAEFEAEESWRRIGFPARKLRWCCSVHKTAPSIVKLKEIYKTKYPEAQRPFKVMVFDGVRAEESDARSTYTMISDGNKHAVQFNCIDEWINVLLSAIDYNPKGYVSKTQKMAMLSRLLPFVEKRINLIELAPKETGKSYVFAQISKYGWLVSGGSISRAKMFYDISKRTQGLVSRYDYVAFDEIQSIKFTDAMEMQGALKGYLESGEYRVGDSRGVGDAGLILLGNIDSELMDVNQNMFKDLPDIFHESALLDRFHGFIKGWNIPKMKESLKANGWALNTEYFGEIMHYLRDELAYRAVVDQLLQLPKNSATRDTEAIKRICTGYLKLLFPNATDVSKVDVSLFETYCLAPAMEMRRVIKTQLGIIDEGEFGGMTIPEITIKEQYREK